MCDQDHFEDDRLDFEARGLVTRRQFGVLLGAGVAMLLPQVVNAVAVTESEVTIKTPDGTCDAYFVHPASGTAAAVLVWPDIFGLRPAFRTMGKRLAETGYSVLVVNPFYRVKKAPTADAGAATPIPSLIPLAQALNETTHTSDAKAFIAWLDQQPSVAKNRKVGTQGYCMGGPIAFRTAAAVPDRVGASPSRESDRCDVRAVGEMIEGEHRRVDEIAEDVDVALFEHRRDLDAGHEGDAAGRAGRSRLGATADGVVIGHAEHGDAVSGGTVDECRRREPAVRGSGMGVEIDQLTVRAAGAGRASGLRSPSRSRSARYSLISMSRCSRSSSANSRKIFLPSESSKRSPYLRKNLCESRSQRMPTSRA